MSQPAYLEKLCSLFFHSFAIILKSYVKQNSYVNSLVNFIEKQDKLAKSQSLAKKFNTNSNKAFIKAPNFPKFSTLLFILLSTKNCWDIDKYDIGKYNVGFMIIRLRWQT